MWVYTEAQQGARKYTVSDAARRVGAGDAVLLDVRPRYQVERARVPGSVNVELFRESTSRDVASVVRRTALKNANPLTALYDKRICERNEDFIDDLKAVDGITRDSDIIVCCQEGLRSKMAADAMFLLGYNNVGYLD